MNLEVVEDDDLTRLQSGRELGLDVEVEGAPVHRAIDQPRCRQAARAQGRDEGLALPVAERSRTGKPLTFRRSSAQTRELRVRRSLVNEHEAMRDRTHDRQPLVDPDVALPGDVRSSALAGQ